MRKEEEVEGAGRIVLVGTELMSESRIAEGARALGYEVQAAGTIEAVITALALAPADVLILDLQAEGVPWREAVEVARRAGDSGLAVLAYGRHIKPELAAAARDAGCDLVVARSEVMGDLRGVIERALGAASHRLKS